jgi:NADPH:quinone reductase-like Zn-dependent oxidoreductase
VRALTHDTFGAPESVLGVAEVDTEEPGAGQVRVRTILAPIHNHDLWTVRGSYGFKPSLPGARSGTEAVGVVDAVGPGVDRVTVGQRVATGGSFGAWAESFLADAAGVIPVPEAMTDEQASQLVSMPFSAISLLHVLQTEAGVAEGDWIVQNAANGAVGRMLAQLAAARGVRVVSLVRRSSGVDELSSQGIGDVVATDADDWRDQVTAITGGAPIRAGVESVGGAAAGDLVDLLAENGTLVVFGAMASPTLEIPSGAVIFKQVTVRGFWGSVVSNTMDAALKGQLFGELVTRVLDGSLTLPVAEVFAFEDIARAVEASNTPGRIGKVLLRP